MSFRARHLHLPCYKLDIDLAFVKSGLPGTDSPRGRTRLRLVRPLGLSVPDKPLITQAAADIFNVKFRQERWLHIWRSICIQHVQMEAGLNSDPGNDSFSDKIRDAKHVDRSTHYSTCRSTQVKSASTDLWPQEMFTFSEMLALFRVGKQFRSLEPGPSRAWYFPRDMLLLTTTARERAWRLLKITGPLIGWFDGDSPIPGISPWLAPLSRCTLYIVEVQRTLCSCLFVFEIRTVASTLHPSIRLVDREGVESVWKAACAVRTSRNCHEDDDDALRVRCIQSQFAMLYFSSLTYRSSDLFFLNFESHVDQT